MVQFVRNIYKFMKRYLHKVNNDDCNINPEVKKPWVSRDSYLENKYKRVKIYNGETSCTPSSRYAANQNDSTDSCSQISLTSSKKCSDLSTQEISFTDSTTEDETMDSKSNKKEKGKYSNRKSKQTECPSRNRSCMKKKSKNRMKPESKKCVKEENQEETSEIETEEKMNGRINTVALCPKSNGNKRKRAIDSSKSEHLDNKLREMVLTVREKCLKNKFDAIEAKATSLWFDHSSKLPQCHDCNSKNKQWDKLNCSQKLPFYWAAISESFLHEAPFDNFLRFYLDENKIEENCVNNSNFIEEMKKLWMNMGENEKMPFIMESFMYRVSLGKVDVRSDKLIKEELEEIYNRTLCNHIF